MDAIRISNGRKRRRRAAAGIRAAVLLAGAALVFVVWCLAGPLSLAQAQPSADIYTVIVNPKNPQSSIDRELAAQTFLKKVVTWEQGGVIRPVDLVPDSPVRRKFSEQVLGRSVAAVRSYWLQVVFSGRGVPPPELGSDEEVIRYVLREPGAIGYVSSRVDLRGARVLVVR